MTKQIDTSELSHITEAGMQYTACCAPVLHLTLKKYWFDMIKSGVKKEEYREIKGYWIKRLFRFPEIFDCLKNSCIECKHRIDIDNIPACSFDKKYKTECDNYKFKWNDRYFKQYSIIEFKNGYSKNAPSIRVEFKGIRIGKPKIEWCIDAIEFDQDNGAYDDCFIIELGSVLF